MGTSVIEVSHFAKKYHDHWAVKDLSFSVAEGEIFAVLGPNGAGKTTTLESIEGIREYEGGTIKVNGLDPLRHAAKMMRFAGIQLQSQGLPGAMTVNEAVEFMAAYHKTRPNWSLARRLGLDAKLKTPFSSLSTGYQRRLMLCLAGAHDPKIIFLDEPTAGLDVETRNELHTLIHEWKAAGKTVILATHDMAEAENLADKVLVIIRGRLAACATVRDLTSQGNIKTKVSVTTQNNSLLLNIPSPPDSSPANVDCRTLVFRTSDTASCVKFILEEVRRSGDVLEDLRVERPSLEERFLEMIKEEAV